MADEEEIEDNTGERKGDRPKWKAQKEGQKLRDKWKRRLMTKSQEGGK